MLYSLYKDGNEINRIVAEQSFVEKYCQQEDLTYKIIERTIRNNTPTIEERISALESATIALMMEGIENV